MSLSPVVFGVAPSAGQPGLPSGLSIRFFHHAFGTICQMHLPL
jgi:hypothetical protein